MHKRIISLTLAVLMCLSAFSLSVSSAGSAVISASYDGGEMTYTGTGFSPNTNYKIRLVDNSTGTPIVKDTINNAQSDQYGMVNITRTSGALTLPGDYTVYIDNFSGTSVANTTTIYNSNVYYYIIVLPGINGSGSSASESAAKGNSVQLNADPANGYRLSSWDIVRGSASVSGNMLTVNNDNTDNIVLQPIFEVIPKSISANYNNGVVICTGEGFLPNTQYKIRVVGLGKAITVDNIKSSAEGTIYKEVTVGSLESGVTYTVYLDNWQGTSEANTTFDVPTSGGTTPSVPGIPQNFTATPGNGKVTLSWNAPSDNGGAAITGYKVSKDGGSTWTDVSLVTSYTFTGLSNGTSYTFKVRAVNSAGNGAEATLTATPVSGGGGGGGGGGSPWYPSNPGDSGNSGGSGDGGSSSSSGSGSSSSSSSSTDSGVQINGKSKPGIKKNDDGSYTIPKSDISGLSKPFVVSVPFTPSSIRNPNSYVVTQIKDGEQTIITMSYYKNGKMYFWISEAGTYTVKYNGKTLTDISKHWAEDYITFVTSHELMTHVGSNKFAPGTALTRAMFATVLARLDGVDLSGYTKSRFTDVKADQWYTAAVEWAASKGIIKGVGDNKFDPDASVTREQIAVMLDRYVAYKKYTLPNADSKVTFKDDAKISSWAKDSVEKIQQAGIVNGTNGMYNPQNAPTRAEIATMFTRLIMALFS